MRRGVRWVVFFEISGLWTYSGTEVSWSEFRSIKTMLNNLQTQPTKDFGSFLLRVTLEMTLDQQI